MPLGIGDSPKKWMFLAFKDGFMYNKVRNLRK